MQAFVYCWTDKLTNKLYVGWHKGHPEDGYICSSKLMKEQYDMRRSDFSRTIIAFGSSDDCITLERSILSSVDAKSDASFYNQTNGNKDFVCKGHTESSRRLMSSRRKGKPSSMKGKSHSIETRILMASIVRASGEQHSMFGKKYTEEEKQKMSEACRGIPKSDSMKKRLSEFSKNSMWITNGINCKRILKGTSIPEGYRPGKKIQKGN